MATLFTHYKSMGIFSRAANSAVSGGIWPNFELLKALMHVIITSKIDKDEKQPRMKKGIKQCLFDTPRRVMVNIENDVRIRMPQHICKKQVLS